MPWRRTIRWTFVVLGVLVFAAAVVGYLFLQSRSFQEYALRTIVKETNDATSGRAEIRNFDFELSTLTAHLYNITLHGSERPTNYHSCSSTNLQSVSRFNPCYIARLR